MTKLSPGAEALRDKLSEGWIAKWGAECDWDGQNPAENQAARAIARTIVEELGITKKRVMSMQDLAKWVDLQLWPNAPQIASHLRYAAQADSTLLELARESEPGK